MQIVLPANWCEVLRMLYVISARCAAESPNHFCVLSRRRKSLAWSRPNSTKIFCEEQCSVSPRDIARASLWATRDSV